MRMWCWWNDMNCAQNNSTTSSSTPQPKRKQNMRDVKQINIREERAQTRQTFLRSFVHAVNKRTVKKGGKDEAKVNETFQPHFISFSSSTRNICHFSILLFRLRTKKNFPRSCYHFSVACLMGFSLSPMYFDSSRKGQTWRMKKWMLMRNETDGFKIEPTFTARRPTVDCILETNHFSKQIFRLLGWRQYYASFRSRSWRSINLILKYIIDQHWYSICALQRHMAMDLLLVFLFFCLPCCVLYIKGPEEIIQFYYKSEHSAPNNARKELKQLRS